MIGGDEGEAGAVDAVAEVGGGVVAFAFEDVAEVAAAFGAGDFGAEHSAGVVGGGGDVFCVGRIVEGWPAALGVEFLAGAKEVSTAGGAMVGAFALGHEFPVNLAAGHFGACLAEDAILLGGEEVFPLGIGFLDFPGGFWWGAI